MSDESYGMEFGHCYVVEASFASNKPVSRYVAYGVINGTLKLACNDVTANGQRITITDLAFFRVVGKIAAMSHPNSQSMPTDTAPYSTIEDTDARPVITLNERSPSVTVQGSGTNQVIVSLLTVEDRTVIVVTSAGTARNGGHTAHDDPPDFIHDGISWKMTN